MSDATTETPAGKAAPPIARPPRPPKAFAAARSAVYVVLSGLWLLLAGLVALPILFMPKGAGWGAFRIWARVNLWLLRVVCGQRMRVLGRENVPEGAALVAAKHMAPWETFALVPVLPRPTYILKRELLRLPVWGWYARHFGMIPVDRAAGASALMSMSKAAQEAVADGRQILIFPEGTRKRPGDPPDYKTGVALLYRSLGVPCTPVALNSGLFAEHRSFIRYPGTITVSFLPPLPPDLPRAAFLAALQSAIEEETQRLLADPEAP